MPDAAPTNNLTKSQAQRRQRVIRAAMDLATRGGYEEVQMRAVSHHADVALGTIYRYFTSKDHLLAAALLEWNEELEREVSRRPPRGDTTAERVVDILRRATRTMERQPKLAAAVVTALTSSDDPVGDCQREMNEVMKRIQSVAFPEGFDLATKDGVIRVLEHVWFSVLLGWVNDWMSIGEAGDELASAAHFLLDQYG